LVTLLPLGVVPPRPLFGVGLGIVDCEPGLVNGELGLVLLVVGGKVPLCG
jgi:hypothetical protein